MDLKLHVWRQAGPGEAGQIQHYEGKDLSPDMSFLEMLDVVNERLIEKGDDPITFDHDCREGICGACGLMINGVAHGPQAGTTACQLHLRQFKDGDDVWIEPWRSAAFPVLKDLMVDRSAFDRVIESGGFISVNTGSAPDANEMPVPKPNADMAFEAAACIGCGACVAQCPQRRRPAVHLGQGLAPRPGASGPARALRPGRFKMVARMEAGSLRLVHQPQANARRCARRRSRSTTSPV